ncbi:MAG: hypothetical protein Q7S28_02165, partial [bacterium]|nr:hypothetical protein [bacterium]
GKEGTQEKTKRKILIVTDVVASGNSLEPLCDALYKEKIDFDIATIGLANYSDTEGKDVEEQIKNHRAEIEEKLHGNIFFGEKGVPRIYNKSDLAGVYKESQELHAHRADPKDVDVAASRNEAALLSEELVGWYGGKTVKEGDRA